MYITASREVALPFNSTCYCNINLDQGTAAILHVALCISLHFMRLGFSVNTLARDFTVDTLVFFYFTYSPLFYYKTW